MKINFNEVHLKSTKMGKCTKCGKSAERSKEFWQTINPFNKTSDGRAKTREDIYQELRLEIANWKKEPLLHVKCEQRN